jgi:hypothetical protein
LASELRQTIGNKLFFSLVVSFLEVGKIQDLPSKIWQTVGDALTNVAQRHECLACSKLKKKSRRYYFVRSAN